MRIVMAIAVLALALGAAPARAGGDASAACKAAKARAAGKKAAALLKAFGKNYKGVNPSKLAQDVSKAESKFTAGFSKAESKGGCATTGDGAAIEAKVNAFILGTIEEQGAFCGNFIQGGSEECDAGPTGGPSPSCFISCNVDCTCYECGDGVVNVGDQCDDGAANGTPDSCCTLMCTFKPASTPCTDTDGNPATTAGCNGAGDCDQLHIEE